jgi:hypothetical protein
VSLGPVAALRASQLLELLESFSIEQSAACLYARKTRFGADCAMTMMIAVPGALLSAARAHADAGLQQAVNDEVVLVARSRKNPRRDVAHIRAILI